MEELGRFENYTDRRAVCRKMKITVPQSVSCLLHPSAWLIEWRELFFHHCDPGSILRFHVLVSLFDVLSMPQGFFSMLLGFPPSKKNKNHKWQFSIVVCHEIQNVEIVSKDLTHDDEKQRLQWVTINVVDAHVPWVFLWGECCIFTSCCQQWTRFDRLHCVNKMF